MADKPVTVRREQVECQIGRLADEATRRNSALVFVMGLADSSLC